jgi:hypothetical protein
MGLNVYIVYMLYLAISKVIPLYLLQSKWAPFFYIGLIIAIVHSFGPYLSSSILKISRPFQPHNYGFLTQFLYYYLQYHHSTVVYNILYIFCDIHLSCTFFFPIKMPHNFIGVAARSTNHISYSQWALGPLRVVLQAVTRFTVLEVQ